MNYDNLKNGIRAVIKENGNEEITGPIMQDSLISIVNALAAGRVCMGVATNDTDPGTPDGNVFYFALMPGQYQHFNYIEVGYGETAILFNTESGWQKAVISNGNPALIRGRWLQDANPIHFEPFLDTELNLIPQLAQNGIQVLLCGNSDYYGSEVRLPVIWVANKGADGYTLRYQWWDDSDQSVKLDTANM